MRNTEYKSNFRIPSISSAVGIGSIFLFSYLTFIPAQTFAESLIVDPTEKRSLSQISTMQEMSQQICINSREDEAKQLLDARPDNSGQMQTKTYWVTKLKDGNCWMTQNLAYDGGGKKIDSISSWVTTGHTPAVGSKTAAYLDMNNYIYSYPGGGQGASQLTCHGVDSFADAACKDYYSEVTTLTGAEDMHYRVGNYYSWNAAVNGTGVIDGNTITSGEALGSICPSGWRLPTSGTNGDFEALMKLYGWTSSTDYTGAFTMNNGKGVFGQPLFFTYTGTINLGTIYQGATVGSYWSSTPSSSNDQAFYFIFDRSVHPAYNSGSNEIGRSVRCLAEGGGFPDPILADDQASVAITVSPVINLDVTKSADDMVVDFNSIDTSTIDINVSSNQKYQVTLTTDQPNLAPQKSDNSEYSIKMVGTSGGIVEKGKNGWGIKKKLSATNDNNLGSLVNEPTYSPIGINNDQVTFYRSAGPEALTNQTDPANPLQLEVGVTVDQSLPSDTYSTMVTVTAMAY